MIIRRFLSICQRRGVIAGGSPPIGYNGRRFVSVRGHSFGRCVCAPSTTRLPRKTHPSSARNFPGVLVPPCPSAERARVPTEFLNPILAADMLQVDRELRE